MICKHCGSSNLIKSGFKKEKQRYSCKKCFRKCVEGDSRMYKPQERNSFIALAIILYGKMGCSYRGIATLFGCSAKTVMMWIKQEAQKIKLNKVNENQVKKIEIDEMWHFISKKNKNCGSSKQLTLKQRDY